jgi:hypothetical protein
MLAENKENIGFSLIKCITEEKLHKTHGEIEHSRPQIASVSIKNPIFKKRLNLFLSSIPMFIKGLLAA